jgi:hypothetical protein
VAITSPVATKWKPKAVAEAALLEADYEGGFSYR